MKLTLTTLLFIISQFVVSQMTYIPNDNFEAYLEANGMGNGIANDDSVYTAAIDTVTYLNVNGINIQNMQGIEYFTALEELHCNNCGLGWLGLYNNPVLKYLDYGNNDIAMLNVNSCSALETLICNGYNSNGTLNLDLSQNSALKYLDCRFQINSVVLAPTADLEYLDYSYNGLGTAINVSQMPSLDYLICSYNGLMSLNVSQNPTLTMLICDQNQISNLDVSQNPQLSYLDCSQNPLGTINVTQNPSLITFHCNGNLLSTLDISQNPLLYYLDCSFNTLSSLNISQNPQLHDLRCNYNNLVTLNVSQNLALVKLYCFGNSINSLDVSQNTLLSELLCMSNELVSLDVSNNLLLEQLYCNDNQITSLDLSNNSSLYILTVNYNDLYCLNVKNGSNIAMGNSMFGATDNPNLTCIEVDNAAWSTANWFNIDAQSYFSEDCSSLCSWGITELSKDTKELVRIVDLLGRETEFKTNTPLIYIYSDGTTERVMKLEK